MLDWYCNIISISPATLFTRYQFFKSPVVRQFSLQTDLHRNLLADMEKRKTTSTPNAAGLSNPELFQLMHHHTRLLREKKKLKKLKMKRWKKKGREKKKVITTTNSKSSPMRGL
jgi:hypothetical protein